MIMTDLSASTDAVKRHLRDNGFRGTTNGLRIFTFPGSDGRVTSVVRSAHPAATWPALYATRLVDALRGLPGADVSIRPIVDKVVVVWDGA